MDFLLENPVGVAIAGGLLVVATGVGWMQTGKKPILFASLALLLLTVVGVWVSIAIRTDQEQIKAFVYEGASELENNQIDKVLSRIHPDASEVLQRAKGELSRYEFKSVSIVGFYDLTIDRTTVPHTASVSIDVIASGRFGSNSGKGGRALQLKFRRDGQRWLVYDFSEKAFPLLQ